MNETDTFIAYLIAHEVTHHYAEYDLTEDEADLRVEAFDCAEFWVGEDGYVLCTDEQTVEARRLYNAIESPPADMF